MEYLDYLVFEQYQVSDVTYIRVTRNADISPDDENYADNDDFSLYYERDIEQETANGSGAAGSCQSIENKETEKYLCEKLNITPACIFRTKIPMKLDNIFR